MALKICELWPFRKCLCLFEKCQCRFPVLIFVGLTLVFLVAFSTVVHSLIRYITSSSSEPAISAALLLMLNMVAMALCWIVVRFWKLNKAADDEEEANPPVQQVGPEGSQPQHISSVQTPPTSFYQSKQLLYKQPHVLYEPSQPAFYEPMQYNWSRTPDPR